MKHKVNRMDASNVKPKEVWYVHSGASNHMTNHKEWFSFLEKPESESFIKEVGQIIAQGRCREDFGP